MSLEFWNTVCITDPKYTKPVKLGRAFTAIDPMYQVMKATEAMGIVTEGWGFNVQEVQHLPTDQVAVKVRVWKGDKESYIEQWGQNGLYIDKAKSMPDTDCMKKATTDGLTKCLSYFGFNADVFLGKFDDNKYVEKVKQELANKAKQEYVKVELTPKQKQQAIHDWFIKKLAGVKNIDEWIALDKDQKNKDARDKMFNDNLDLCGLIDIAFENKRVELISSETV